MSAREIDPVDIDPTLYCARSEFERHTRESFRLAREARQAELSAARVAARAAAAAQAESDRVAAYAATQRRITRAVLPPAAVAWVLCLLGAIAALAGWP